MAARGGISRRDFCKLALTSLGGAVLAACGARRPEPAPTITISPTPSETLPVVSENIEAPAPSPIPTATELVCLHLLAPENGAKLSAMGKVTFSWEPMADAAAYWLEITLPTGQTVTFDARTASRDQYLEAFSTAGVYQWQVSALGHGGGLLCTSEPFSFQKGE